MTDINENTGAYSVLFNSSILLNEQTEPILEALAQLQPYLETGRLYHHGALQRLIFPFHRTNGYLAFDGTRANPCTRAVSSKKPVSDLYAVQLLGSTLVDSCTLAEAIDKGYIRPDNLRPADLELRKLHRYLQFACLTTGPLEQDAPWS
jgi:hypothetical protein